jgi:hypothetical protein
MFRTRDRNYLYIVILYIVLTITYLISEYFITGHRFGVPLDDTWIHYRFAENFANGHFFEYNIGDPTPGTTSPFWIIILSIPFLIYSRFFMAFSLLIGSIFLLLTCLEIYRLAKRLGFNENYSFLISLLTLLAGRLLWSSLSGMEITLFCYLTVVTAGIHIKELESNKAFIVTGLLLGIAGITRPEAYLLAAIYYILTAILLRNVIKKNILHLALSAIIFLIIIMPYHLFSHAITGKFLPSTFEGQNAGFYLTPNFTFLVETGKLFFRDNIIILLLWIVSSVYFIYRLVRNKTDKKFILIYLWVIFLPAISAFIAPNWRHHGRYLIPIIPFINIVSIDILQKFERYLRRKNFRFTAIAKKITPAVLVIFTLFSTFTYDIALGLNVENINDQQVKIAEWLKHNFPDETAFGMNDIGAITFITKKKTIDMEGLITPDVFKLRKMSLEEGNKNLLALLKRNKVNYIIIYPDWYEYLMEHYSNALQQVYSARLKKNTICGEIEMFVYKINWDEINLK